MVNLDDITIEQIGALFGAQEDLGCTATFEEYIRWFKSLGILNDEAIDLKQQYSRYMAICDISRLNIEPPTRVIDFNSPLDYSRVSTYNTEQYALMALGAVLAYKILK